MKKYAIIWILLIALFPTVNGQLLSVNDSIELHGFAVEKKYDDYIKKLGDLGEAAYKKQDLETILFLGEHLKKIEVDELDSNE